jgi:3-hydroxyacyl-CoA dehydrogenase
MNKREPRTVKRVAVVGSGTIGASWAVYFLAQGLDVVATDPMPTAEAFLRSFVERAWPDLTSVGLAEGANKERLRITKELDESLTDVDWVQESGPENLILKRELFVAVDRLTADDVVIASSSSGLPISEIQAGCVHPGRCVIGHPFNPPHLIPLVEVVGGRETSERTIERAMAFYAEIGKRPIRIRKEVNGHVANRLQAALWKECCHLVSEGVISVRDVDTAICWGPGLRWAVMGPNLLFHVGGGAGGMRNFLEHLGGSFNAWWKELGNVELSSAMREMLIAGAEDEAGGASISDLERERDAMLLKILALRQNK